MALQKLNAQVLEGGLALDDDGNMTLTGNLYATDVGNDDDPIEDFYVSNESIWIGDEHKLQVSSTGKMKFRKRKTTTVPAVIAAAGGTSAGALTHSGKASINLLKKKHWRLYARSLGGSLANAKNKDIFRDNKVDYSEESDASAWQVNDMGETYATVKVGIGNTDPATILHVTGTDALVLPVGDTSERGTATQGGIRYSTELSTFEGYDGSNWGSLGGVIDVDQDTYITAEATTDSDDLDFWTAGTKRMTIDQAGAVTITGTDALVLPAGTTAQRDTATQGGFRFNTETPGFEGYDGSDWGAIGGGASSELTTDTTKELKGSYAETMLISDVFTLGGDLTLTDTLFLAKLSDDGTDITLTDDGTSRTITGQGTLVPGAIFDNTFALATAVQPNITSIGTTASIKVPTGTTAQRGTALAGGIRYNTTLASFEGYSGSAWGSLGGLIDVDQDTYITAEATPDSDNLDFWTAGTQRMIINSSGNVGIGTSPSTLLHLKPSSGDSELTVEAPTTGTTSRITLSNPASSAGGSGNELVFKEGTGGGGANNSKFDFHHSPNSGIFLFRADGSTVWSVPEGSTAVTFAGSVAASGGNSGNWNTAYGWGNHASAGYATSGSQWTTTGNDIYYTTGNVGIGLTSGISEKLYVSGNISATGDVTSSASDERLKENIEIIENAVDKIKTIDGIKFDWVSNIEEIGLKPKNKTEVGLIAQQLEKVLPEAVCPAPFDTPGTGISLSGEHYLTIRYEKVVPLLIEAIKEQQQQIDKLTEKLNGI